MLQYSKSFYLYLRQIIAFYVMSKLFYFEFIILLHQTIWPFGKFYIFLRCPPIYFVSYETKRKKCGFLRFLTISSNYNSMKKTFLLYTYLYDQNFDPVCRTHESSHGLPVILCHRNWGIVAFGCCNIFLVKTLQGSASRSSMGRNMHLVPPLPGLNNFELTDLDWFQKYNYLNIFALP